MNLDTIIWDKIIRIISGDSFVGSFYKRAKLYMTTLVYQSWGGRFSEQVLRR